MLVNRSRPQSASIGSVGDFNPVAVGRFEKDPVTTPPAAAMTGSPTLPITSIPRCLAPSGGEQKLL
jgi:hypothetical protein